MSTIVKKLIQLVVVLFFVTFFSFSLLKLIPGDPVDTLKPFATPEHEHDILPRLKSEVVESAASQTNAAHPRTKIYRLTHLQLEWHHARDAQ